MRIEVTQDDIDQGRPHSASSCAIALAACRALNREVGEVRVGHGILLVDRENTYPQKLSLPKEAKEFICKFDESSDVAPISFDAAPAKVLQVDD